MKESILRVFKLIFQQVVEPLKIYPWGSILNILLISLQLYCLNFIIVLSFLFILPILTDFENILYNSSSLLYLWFIIGYKFHLWFYGICVLISISNEYESNIFRY